MSTVLLVPSVIDANETALSRGNGMGRVRMFAAVRFVVAKP